MSNIANKIYNKEKIILISLTFLEHIIIILQKIFINLHIDDLEAIIECIIE